MLCYSGLPQAGISMTSAIGEQGVRRALARAEAVCRARGARFTAQRRRVYELMVRAGGPVTAYELLAEMSADGGNPAPPTVYRALEFLQAHGLVHRLASQSRFVACEHPEHSHHGGLFLVCSHCGRPGRRAGRLPARGGRAPRGPGPVSGLP